MQRVIRWFFFIVFASSCTAIKPSLVGDRSLSSSQSFSHEGFDRVLHRFVNEFGQVNYTALKEEPHELDRYYGMLATYSPDSHPQLFTTEQSKLAYWLNAYNAAVLKTVVTYYPVASVSDIHPSWLLSVLPEQSGFFLFQRVTFGGVATSLYALEHRVIRERFLDPRVHFALNWASGSCPRLPRYAFTAEHLQAQLDSETRKFIADDRNLLINHQKKAVRLSTIFEWYESDFLKWYEHHFPQQKATLLSYIALYASPERAEEIRRAEHYTVDFFPYDWRLNDQPRKRQPPALL